MVTQFRYKGGPIEAKAPIYKKLNENVIGIEFEYNNTLITDCDECEADCDYCRDDGNSWTDEDVELALNRLVNKGIIINPHNMHMIQKDHNAILERDGSVDGEIILQADYQKNIMNKVNKIHKELNSSILNNGRNTSCHIHRNVNYLVDIGSSKFDYQKATEFLGGILYKISGRDKESYENWCRSMFPPSKYNIHYNSMYTMAKCLDTLDHIINGKYLLCNCDHNNSVETRIFSNYHNFNPETTKLFIDFTNLAMDLSVYMHNKSYVNEFDTLIDWVNDFCNATVRRRKLLKPYKLHNYIVHKEDSKFVEFNGKWTIIYDEVESLINQRYRSYNNQINSLLRIMRDHDISLNASIQINNRINYNDIINAMNKKYNDELDNL